MTWTRTEVFSLTFTRSPFSTEGSNNHCFACCSIRDLIPGVGAPSDPTSVTVPFFAIMIVSFIVNAPCAPLSIRIWSIWQRMHCGPVVVVAPRGPGETATGLGGPSASLALSTCFRLAHCKLLPTKQIVELDLDHFEVSAALDGNSL